jgi:flagellar motor switch protein FliG
MSPASFRKAAILVACLQPDDADAILDQMSTEQAELVRRAVLDLRNVDDAEQQLVIEQFLQTRPVRVSPSADGVALHLSGMAREPDSHAVLDRQAAGAPQRRPRRGVSAQPADHVPHGPMVFCDLVGLDHRSLAEVFGRADLEVTTIALAGASSDLAGHILARLPVRDAHQFNREIHRLGPLRLSDVEHAQAELALLAERLCLQGIVRRPTVIRRRIAA